LITGPALTSPGNFALSINLTAYVHFGPITLPIPQSITFYSIIVDQGTGIQALSRTHFDASPNYPNPFSDKTTFAFSTAGSEPVSVKVFNLLGARIYSKEIRSKAGINYTTLDAKDFVPGIYIVTLTNGKATITRRMIVAKNQ